MNIAGVELLKTEAIRKKLETHTGMDVKIRITNVKKREDNEKQADIVFEHVIYYKPDIGSLTFHGNIIMESDENGLKELIEGWEKGKRIPEKIQRGVLELMTRSCCFNGVLIARTINLPPPVFPLTAELEGKKDEKK